ncbi:hypothetical protein AYO20_01411 [Fonsecaea nubica]|uniref:Uncharacterized protein n=1 Tax=Fonsecaea nubica TaxID=856822 RepID=A0A178DCW0_9EURO|nr:hypothetical protein AYO20_01411 [Fonsecaea nubica]OAL39093.1 hypothetical protein AYO20_01411 [Fonsecaea nubica]
MVVFSPQKPLRILHQAPLTPKIISEAKMIVQLFERLADQRASERLRKCKQRIRTWKLRKPSRVSQLMTDDNIASINSQDKKTETHTPKSRPPKPQPDSQGLVDHPPQQIRLHVATYQVSNHHVTRRVASEPYPDYSGAASVVIFSGSTSIQEKRSVMRSFERLESILIVAVAIGDIVTEQWIIDIHRFGRVPALQGDIPLDRSRERRWDFGLKDAIGRGKTGLTHLLAGIMVFLTKQLRSDLENSDRETSQIATMIGADAVKHCLPALKDEGKFSEPEIDLEKDLQNSNPRCDEST